MLSLLSMRETSALQFQSNQNPGALFKKAFVFALFGGQGTNEVYFDDLQNLHEIYKPFMAPFVQSLTEDVLLPLVAEGKRLLTTRLALTLRLGFQVRLLVLISHRFLFHSLLLGLPSWFNIWLFVTSPT